MENESGVPLVMVTLKTNTHLEILGLRRSSACPSSFPPNNVNIDGGDDDNGNKSDEDTLNNNNNENA